MTTEEPHITDEQFAALVDGRLPADEDQRATEHLARCRTCMSAYNDLVRQVHGWKQDARQSAAPVASAGGSRWPRMLLAACIPLVVAVAAWTVFRGNDPSPSSLPELPVAQSELVEMMIALSSYDGMILPGAESAVWADRVIVRSEQVDPVLKSDVEEILDNVAGYHVDPGVVIAGHLATGDNDMARIQLDNGKGEDLSPARFHLLKGIQEWSRPAELEDVEKHFRLALEASPDDPVVRFNLGYCLWAQNRFDEAAAQFASLTGGKSGSLITVRATEALARVEAREPLS